MSYLVLARKYRPRRFDDLIGQEHVGQTLKNAIALGRVHHAFLFTGARGVGKTSAARILATALACEKGPTADPCGTCDLCTEIASGQSVDVVEIDGASNTGVDDVRVLREGVKYAPARARRKVYIIDEVHMLSTSAFNALLKTLEEPPEHVVFILATTEVHKIPATILSRVQRHDFKLIPSARLAEHLVAILGKEKISFDADALRLVARQAGGSVRDALSLLDQLLAFAGKEKLTVENVVRVLGLGDRRLYGELARTVVERAPAGALLALNSAIDRGVDLTQLARSFLGFIHDLEMIGILNDPTAVVDLTLDELAEARALVERVPEGMFQVWFDRWARAVEEGGRSAFPRLVYEMALVDLCRAEPLVPLGDLLPRLEAMEGRLHGRGPAPPGPGRTGGSPRTDSRPSGPSGGASTPAESGGWGPPGMRSGAEADMQSPLGDRAAPARVQPRAVGADPSEFDRLDAEEKWRRLQDAVMHESPLLAAALEHAVVETIAPGAIAIAIGERFQMGQVEAARERLERLFSSLIGQSTRLIVRQGSSGVPMVEARAVVEANAEAEEKRRREEEARSHPMIRKAQDLFGAAVSGVKT